MQPLRHLPTPRRRRDHHLDRGCSTRAAFTYVKVTDAHAIVVGTWGIAGTEWRRTHLRLLLKRGRQ
jgi:hypothetical protein